MSDSDDDDDDWELDDIGGIPASSVRANPRHSSRRLRGERVPNSSDSDEDVEYEKQCHRCAPVLRTLWTAASYVVAALRVITIRAVVVDFRVGDFL